MRRHPEYARSMLEPIAYLRPALEIPYCHHERWDGKGYPRGLKGEEIPRAARIFTAVDVWDALVSDRPYRTHWESERVRSYLAENAGVLFDPQVVAAFLKILGSEEPLASDLPNAVPQVTPAVGVGCDGELTGLDGMREGGSGNGSISENNLNPNCSHFVRSSPEGQPLLNGPHVSLSAQASRLCPFTGDGRESLTELGSAN